VSLTLSPGTGTAVPHPEKQFHEHVVYLYRESDALRYVTISVLRSLAVMPRSWLPPRRTAIGSNKG
jgi:hypothetical protein